MSLPKQLCVGTGNISRSTGKKQRRSGASHALDPSCRESCVRALAGRLAQHGVPVIVMEAERDPVRIGSRAICMQRETLEIWQRLGIGQAIADRGIQWTVGRTYFRGRELFSVELPTSDEHFPPFVNISQSEVEDLLENRVRDLGVEVRRGHRLVEVA